MAADPVRADDTAVQFAGSQKAIFESGKADGAIPLEKLRNEGDLYAIGPVGNLDGEITIFGSQPYISKVRGAAVEIERSWNADAIFLVWTKQARWRDVPIPPTIKSYRDLQTFVKEQASLAGIDPNQPFAFLVKDRPAEIAWHINVDRTDGQKVTQELFAKSKVGYVARNEAVDIVGFYSERDLGVFISRYAPALPRDGTVTNAIHLHFVSRETKATGHIDDIVLGDQAVLSLPDK